ncbi:MAG: tRNA (N6-isopentenyl adenosine(37)-C2)-methylthiotransferase MiaB [Geminicoccaceae bacterium]|nr:tRNA (N6-isopentenyl adenosine(37)-C2)-methylthiotransferase MiaB [Geminicoccaceae bacterium]
MFRKLFIKTYGCQMNVYDSDRMARLLSHHGYARTESVQDADLVLLNTCHIREKAAEKVYSELGRLRAMRDRKAEGEGRQTLLVVAGCVAQAEGDAMIARAPFVDVVVGPQSYHRLPELLARRERSANAIVDTDFPVESKFDLLPAGGVGDDIGERSVSAFLTVQEGCDKFCTFCVVPYTRGAEESRPVTDLLDEARRLVALGAREITLLGQNVNAYHGLDARGRSRGLGDLVRMFAEIDGLERIRYTTSHPVDMSDDLIRAHGEVPQLMPFLHLPVQSGSDVVLRAMNRKYSSDDFRRVVEALRAVRPDLALSSDFIVGFPGERDDDFEATLKLVEEIGFAQSFSFKYSPRPGTPGSLMNAQVKDTVKSERLARLQSLLNEQADAFNAASVGCRTAILLERKGRHPGQLVGKTPHLQAVHLEDGDAHIGDIVDVTIVARNPHSLAGERAERNIAKEEPGA